MEFSSCIIVEYAILEMYMKHANARDIYIVVVDVLIPIKYKVIVDVKTCVLCLATQGKMGFPFFCERKKVMLVLLSQCGMRVL